jgi:hypothetical protein
LLYGLDGQRLWVAGTELREVRLADGADLSRLEYGAGPILQLGYSPLAGRLALAGPTLVLVDPRTARVTWRASETVADCKALAWNPQREELAVAGPALGLCVYIPRPHAQQRAERSQALELRQQARAWWNQQQAEGAKALDWVPKIEADASLSREIKLARLAVLTASLGSN